MQRILSFGVLAVIIAGILYACNFGGGATPTPDTTLLQNVPVLTLAVQATGGTYNAAGQTIPYQYVVTNSGGTALTGPVTITDTKVVPVTCPEVNTVGNNDANLDPAESITCTGIYTIAQEDLNNMRVKSDATASAGGVNSETISTTVGMTLATVLEITSIANPTTYNAAGQVITVTFTVKNTGTTTIGPAQFIIHDDHLGNINCGGADTSLTAGQTFTCNGTYTTTEGDHAAEKVVFNTIIAGGGATNAQPLGTTVTNTALAGGSGSTSGLTPGSTIQHQVNEGEWMLQIARCYGADFNTVRNANPQVINANQIWPVNVLTIPNIGSNGKVYGPPCVTYYTAQSGDTWQSIAQKYNADLAVLLEANKGLSVGNGVKLKIPLNSAGGNPIPPPTNSNEPIRLNFPSGSSTAASSGTLSATKTKARYILTASQGQIITVKLGAPATDLQIAVSSSSGFVLKALDANTNWSGTIPANGDYIIEVVSVSPTDKLFALEVGLAAPQTASVERVADINSGTGDANPMYPAVFNGSLYFNATENNSTGAELWKYDATTNTPSIVKDIFPGGESSNPMFLTSFNGALYFSANGDDGAGVELWRFNGTDAGRFTDINSGAENANPSYMTVFNDHLYFSAKSSDGTGTELWRTDGTTVNRVVDIYSGSGDSNPSYLAVFNGALYFSATSNDGYGTELWKFDGTNLSRVTDINPNVGNSNPAYMTVFNNALYFNANANDGTGTELWKFDGTNASRAADINSGAGDSAPSFLAAFNGALYFSANGNDGAGFELWRFDGTNASRVADINPGAGDSFPSFLAAYNNQLYFEANGGDGTGKELWKFKGP